jgi:hypothetical protein
MTYLVSEGSGTGKRLNRSSFKLELWPPMAKPPGSYAVINRTRDSLAQTTTGRIE